MSLRVGVIGAGGIGQVHLDNLAADERVELAAVCDVNPAGLAEAQAKYGARGYATYSDMLQSERLDALFVCVPPFAHGQIEEEAAARGIHLFVEKPIGLEMEDVRRKAEAIRQAGIISSTGYCLRYLDTVQKAKAYLADRQIAMVRGYYLTKFVQTGWWREVAKSGGQLVEQATHTLDMMRYLAGDIEKVYANMALIASRDIPGVDIPDVSSVNMVFETGAIGHLDTCFIQADHRTGVELMGKNFRVQIDGRTLAITDESGTHVEDSAVDMYKEQDRAFIGAIVAGDHSGILAPYESALKTLEVTLAANDSAKVGSPIDIGHP